MQLSAWNDSTASVSGGKGTTYSRESRGYVKKRTTPEDDYDRLAERIWRRGGGRIKNQADFISVFDSYMRESDQKSNKSLIQGVFERIQKKHPKVSSSLFTEKARVEAFVKAGGKPSAAEFNVLRLSKGRRVYARRTKLVDRWGIERVVFRDKKGRFVPKK